MFFCRFPDIDGLLSDIGVLIGRIQLHRGEGQFEWVDNVLVKALERGYWLTISHANFCRYALLIGSSLAIVVWEPGCSGGACALDRSESF